MTKKEIFTIPNITAFCWSPVGDQIACGSENGDILVYSIEGEKVNEAQSPSNIKTGKKEGYSMK